MARLYRDYVVEARKGLADPERHAPSAVALRSMVEDVVLTPEGYTLGIVLRGARVFRCIPRRPSMFDARWGDDPRDADPRRLTNRAAGVVAVHPRVEIVRLTDVQHTIGAAQDVDVVHVR